MYSRRARPTLRLLKEDLIASWETPYPLRLLKDEAYRDLHPLSELPHPIIAKATESFGTDPSKDHCEGPIHTSTSLPLLEIKASQWRGGVWRDQDSGVHWLIVAGLAKGNHQDHDDFYVRIKQEDTTGAPTRWLPSELDIRLLKQETSSRFLTEWELEIQDQMLHALRIVHEGGSVRIKIVNPQHRDDPTHRRHLVAILDLSVKQVRDLDYESDDIGLEVHPAPSYQGGELLWQVIMRALISLSPPEQGWDRYKDTYSNIAEPGKWTTRIGELESLAANRELAQSEPGQERHFVHRKHLAGSTIDGRGVRAMCGIFFVPTQDHATLPQCRKCQGQWDKLPPEESA